MGKVYGGSALHPVMYAENEAEMLFNATDEFYNFLKEREWEFSASDNYYVSHSERYSGLRIKVKSEPPIYLVISLDKVLGSIIVYTDNCQITDAANQEFSFIFNYKPYSMLSVFIRFIRQLETLKPTQVKPHPLVSNKQWREYKFGNSYFKEMKRAIILQMKKEGDETLSTADV